jgi:signal transduction histidine kinase
MSRTSAPQRRPDNELLTSAAALQALADGIVLCDRAGVVRFVNAAGAQLLGVDVDTLLGRAVADLPGEIALDDRGGEARHITLNRRTFRVSTAPVFSSGDSWARIGSVVVYQDMIREFEARRDMMSTLNMELRGPLVSVRGCVDLLLHGFAGALTAEQNQVLMIARNAGARAVDMLNGLLDLSRLEADAVRLRHEMVDVGAIVRDVAQRAEKKFADRAIGLSLTTPGNLPQLMTDGTHLHRVVEQLLDNACKYTPRGGRVEVHVRRAGEHIQVDVQDNGVGIGADVQRYIFKPFFRADNPLRDEAGGVGVGLTIAEQLVELNGGRIWFASAEGQGSTFSFIIPVGPPPDALC